MKKLSNRKLIYYICIIAVFAALEFVITSFVSLPIGAGGYLNFSDLFVFLLACLVNPIVGGAVGGISGMFSDLYLGYASFAPFTLVIKFLEGLISGYMYVLIAKKQTNEILKIVLTFVSFIVGGIIMAGLYMIPDFITYFNESDTSMTLNVVFLDFGFNLIQGSINACIASILIICFEKSKGFERINNL